MKYHIYQYGPGCKWFDDFDEAVDIFNKLPSEDKYTALGLTDGGYAVDVVFKGDHAGIDGVIASMDIKQSSLLQENSEKVIETLKKLYKVVGVKEEHASQIIEDLTRMADEMDDDLEEM